ncbi:MAG: hypothetical protein A2234_00305 [Elusimicrobia bacterium RIFOXYA2_FULL_58_8]|nr:MAG: hypothetical protein A2285_00945 [Elusimicrobia bacterium RIFOXYA12_FULL_57_11]OGS13249.1 MAG: hypothetical protein A2234_00305 [Elusimicrobia bacterium RIFOXYA2_FULL_58_8]
MNRLSTLNLFILTGLALFYSACPPAARAQQALLWLPSGTAGTAEIITLLENNRDLRLTAALEDLPGELGNRIRNLETEGRLELALTPAGAPPLPLLYSPAHDSVKWEGKPSTSALPGTDRYFSGLRFGFMREAALRRPDKLTPGIAIPPGGLMEDYFPLAKALGARWLACGPLASTAAAVFMAEGVTAVPFVSVSTRSTAETNRFLVFDETAAGDPASVRALLAGELKSPLRQKILTVSEAIKHLTAAAATPAEIAALASPWNNDGPGPGDYTRWASAPAQRGALAALARTRADLILHLNACLGDYAAAKPAFDEYFSAEDGARLMALASANPDVASETEIELRSALGNAYRLMRKTPPSWIFSSLTDADSAARDTEQLQTNTTANGFEIKNTARQPELKGPAAGLSKTADPYKVWKLDRLKLEVLPDAVAFRFVPLEIDNPKKLDSGFSQVFLDLYIDINGRPRAGQSKFLAGRPLRPFPENAWEYALEITPYKAALYTATAAGPKAVALPAPRVQDGAITVNVPRGILKGNPLRWAYSALMLESADLKTFSIADHITADISNGYIHAVRPGGK